VTAPRVHPFTHFTVIPSIDLKDGEVVRLLRGDMNRATVYGDDPAAAACAFEAAGAELIHIVDLDGAITGAPRNLASVRAIRAAVTCRLDVSGGLRTIDSVGAVIDAGADMVSIGSAAFLNPALIAEACARYPGRIFGSLDLRNGKLAIKGWVKTSDLSLAEAVIRFREAGVAAIIVTDISRDGTESGADVAIFAESARLARVPVIASGGIASLADLRSLKSLFPEGVVGAITGRALYEGRFSLSAALAAVR
jgi:phosphoribosylformimino-5-aminoimidazole carboxamide ribotide isomerase